MSDFDMYESEIEDLYRPKEEPKVVLTLEEAKLISIFFGDVVYSRGINLTERERSLWSMLTKRIVQAEGK